jgi:hypothetical protein
MTADKKSERTHRAALVIMAKVPVSGQVKTRLIPALGANGAAALAEKLLNHTLTTAQQTQVFAHVELCVSPSVDHLNLKADQRGLDITPQGDGDLGARMQRAFERLLRNHDAVVMIGTDAPDMTAALLDRAASELTQSDAVFVPALDGGYTLIGLAKTHAHHLSRLFTDIPWSTGEVMAVTRDRLQSLATEVGLKWHEYPPMADIDEPEDLVRLPREW